MLLLRPASCAASDIAFDPKPPFIDLAVRSPYPEQHSFPYTLSSTFQYESLRRYMYASYSYSKPRFISTYLVRYSSTFCYVLHRLDPTAATVYFVFLEQDLVLYRTGR